MVEDEMTTEQILADLKHKMQWLESILLSMKAEHDARIASLEPKPHTMETIYTE